jgi:superfamily I DNA/RNA helicase
MQRVVSHGISHWDELNEFSNEIARFELKISYRQSPRLLKIAALLYKQTVGEEPPFHSAFRSTNNDLPALFYSHIEPVAQIRWIAERILEIYRSNEDRLPSIAVLVSSEDQVQETFELLQASLMEHSIPAEPCSGGRILGTKAKVRVSAFNLSKVSSSKPFFSRGPIKLPQRIRIW